ncbi:hypothetical protein TH53_01930 [Pedobacter lusitanus]|uniref:FecR protein n=1 Tax=Pedobacter lusitanus TaxID=1503925 RepID=A0A0D0G1K7_9SPHI|nr:FecR domain-containing protein [Pedobacter lusitanus]KIO78679.1 hypothetical protein TH53_01930 [Pedobacter lusitanus]
MEITGEIIRRYHLGQCTAAETKAVESWLESEDAEVSYPEDFDKINYQQQSWEKISMRYGLGLNEESISAPAEKKNTRSLRLFWQAVACIAVVMFLGLSYRFLSSDRKTLPALSYQTIKARKGEKKYAMLSDGTQVWLNSESSLSFPTQFAGDKRSISFTGEAYFRVAKNPNKRFIINSPRTRTEVLGTRFDLRDYPEEDKSELVVEEGRVSFSGAKYSGELILTASQKGIFNAGDNPGLKQSTVQNSKKYMDWKENRLVLEDLNLEQIRLILERWYNIKLVIKDKNLEQERYTGSFNNPNIHEVLQSICFAIKSQYHQQNETFTISR